MTTPPRIAVMGAGAVGCYHGALLARGGCAVTMIGRPAHVDAMRRDGLRLRSVPLGFDAAVAVDAATEPAAVRGAGLVLVCVKSTDTDDAAAQIAPHLAPGAVVMSLQNGVDNAERLAARLPQTVIPAVVYVATEMEAPGVVRHHGRGELVIGALQPSRLEALRPLLQRLAALFGRCGVPVQVSDDVIAALWGKLIVNCAYNAISALAQAPYGRLVQLPEVVAVMREVVDEALAVAGAAGVELDARAMHEAVGRIAATMASQRSSTAQDVARRKPTEIDHLNGYLVQRGSALGVPTPVNRTLHALVKAVEAGYAT